MKILVIEKKITHSDVNTMMNDFPEKRDEPRTRGENLGWKMVFLDKGRIIWFMM